jgi:methionine synthase I (cobalamin-dependent)
MDISDKLNDDRLLLFDGAIGTLLHSMNLEEKTIQSLHLRKTVHQLLETMISSP